MTLVQAEHLFMVVVKCMGGYVTTADYLAFDPTVLKGGLIITRRRRKNMRTYGLTSMPVRCRFTSERSLLQSDPI